jgi:hypothetical protein
MLIYVHIPKTAGSTMRSLLQRNFKRRFFGVYTDRRGEFLTDDELIQLVRHIYPAKEVLSGHDIRPLQEKSVQGIDLRYVTFIRHPFSRAISLYYFEKKHTVSSHVSQKSFKEYVQQRPSHDKAISNWQAFNISSQGTFEHAKELLDDFLMVGLVERFDLSLIWLQECLGENYLRYIGYTRQNVSRKKQYSISNLPQNIQDELADLNQEDLKLYEYAKKRLEEDLKKLTNREDKLRRLQDAKRRAQLCSNLLAPFTLSGTILNRALYKIRRKRDAEETLAP